MIYLFLWLSFFFIRDVFFGFFVRMFFQESIQFDSGVCYFWKAISYHQNPQKWFTGAQEPFKWWQNSWDRFSWNMKKCCFWAFQKQDHPLLWNFFFSISHVSSLETECFAKNLLFYLLASYSLALPKNKSCFTNFKT